jgi:hypothetical protein
VTTVGAISLPEALDRTGRTAATGQRYSPQG